MADLILDSGTTAADDFWTGETADQRRIRAWFSKPVVRAWRSLLLTLLLSLGLAFAVEFIARGSLATTLAFFGDIHRPALATVVLFALVALVIDALLGRTHGGLLVIAPLVLIPAWISSEKGMYLSDPFYPTDFLYAHQIVELLPLLVSDRPKTAVALAVAVVAGLLLVVAAFRGWRRRAPRLTRKARLARLVLTVPALAAFVSIMDYATFSWARDRLQIIPMMWDQKENYAFNGFTLAFALNLPMADVSKPSGYSADAVGNIAGFPAASVPADKPDIIIVMSESFWDPTRLPGVKITPDPIPTVREMSSGSMFSPEFGGMTANIEFEALTGFSNAFLPYGSIPYQQYIRRPLPSLATFLQSQGYATRALHPFSAWFWNRSPVYQAFGFDRFMSEDKLPPLQKRGQLPSDIAFTDEIIRQADKMDKPFFFFAVTLQGHGPYEPNRYPDAKHKVDARVSAWSRESIVSYAEGASDADRGLKRLIDWASKRKRRTVIAFFGDHLPPLGPVYVETGFMKEPVASRKAPIAEMTVEHETPLVIWSNRSGKVDDVGGISPAFIPLQVLKAAGITHPYYTGFLGGVHDRFRVVDRTMLIDADGKDHPDWSRNRELDPQIRDFRFLQYDMMFDHRTAAPKFFPEMAHPSG